MKIVIIEDKCCGAGQCVLSAPEVFDQRDDGVVIVLNETPDASQHENVRRAARLCPATAILLEE